MNVILLAPTPPPYGGIAGWTARMLNSSLKNGWTVSVVDEKVIGNRSVFDGKNISLFCEIKRCFKIWKNLIVELKNNDSKIVQVCIPAGTRSMLREIISAIITKIYHRKFIVHFRCTLPNMINSNISFFVFKTLIKFSDHLFLLNNASSKFIIDNKIKISYDVIPNFVETKYLYNRKKYSKKVRNILYVGGVIEEKGCQIISDVASFFSNITFTLIGKVGMDISSFPSNVICLGEKNKDFVYKELKNNDVFLFLSYFKGEGFSNALAEAMSCSLPCIVSDWAANKDMIENLGGIVLKNNDVENVKNAIFEISDLNKRKNMGRWNYNKIVNYYSDKKVLDMYVDAYEKLLGSEL